MKFLIVFIALFMRHQLPLSQRSSRSRSFQRWLQLALSSPLIARAPRLIKYLLIVVMPAALGMVAFHYLEQYFWGLLAFVLEIILLLYVLSHVSFQRHFQQYKQDVMAGNLQSAYHCAEQYIALPEIELVDDAHTLNLQVIKTLLQRWFEYFFLMVFWYMVADVGGVLLAWFSVQYARASHCDERGWKRGGPATPNGPPNNHHTVPPSQIPEALLLLGGSLPLRWSTATGTTSTPGHATHSRHSWHSAHARHASHSGHPRHSTHPGHASHAGHVALAHLLHEAAHFLEVGQHLVHICGLMAAAAGNPATP